MKRQGNILIVDDNANVLTALKLLLKPYFTTIRTLDSPVTLPSVLAESEWQVILLDMNFSAGINSGNEGLYWLHRIKAKSPDTAVVLFTAYADIELAVRGIKEGASDFVVKPWDNQKMIDTLLKSAQQQKPSAKPSAPIPSSQKMYWGNSTAMKQLQALVEKVAPTEATILITGENGTGKEVLAREIHALSARRHKSMISVDMGALTETLFESELFGHVKGAFTDAHTDRPGKFEAAQGSTLFLDEIGNLTYHLQAKLLTAIQRKSVVRVGSNTPIATDIRLICATNRDLPSLVKAGSFREDLFYRINTIHMEIPPLRERPEDIVPLAEHFMRHYGEQYGKQGLQLKDEARKRLAAYAWPGNIRELEHVMEKAVIISNSLLLDEELFPLPQRTTTNNMSTALTLEDMEKQMISKTIDECCGNLSAVAARLGISRQTLYNKMKKYTL